VALRRQGRLENHHIGGKFVNGSHGLVKTLSLTDNTDVVFKREYFA
jgi:hypothetical protein